ncbi:class I SAM-dependent methyltransferase [Alteraurantiacibacter lauratis]|uniref:Class I SAM-dependent methyltransferase n=2 Tax=Alteraurantiacibacter lauratis TaxID=2054627 RepID=A0ABV7EEQ3_9SPHN
MRISAALMTACALALSAPAAAQAPSAAHHHHPANPALADALASPIRDGDRARDRWRNPAETLTFFGIEPGMTVVDFMPSGGWFSRILIPYLGAQGTYIGLNPNVGESGGPGFFQSMRNTAENFPGQAAGWVPAGGARVIGANIGSVPEELNGTVDRVMIMREIHNIRRFGWFHDLAVTLRALLKDDGLVGVEQHRARPDAPASYVLGDNGYQREQDVIALFEAYGFELVARSNINANPADPANWERGVWSLPPSFAGAPEGSEERARRAAIGESDRMTLLFRKRP